MNASSPVHALMGNAARVTILKRGDSLLITESSLASKATTTSTLPLEILNVPEMLELSLLQRLHCSDPMGSSP